MARSEKTALAQRPVSAAVSATADRAARVRFLATSTIYFVCCVKVVYTKVDSEGGFVDV